MREIDPMDVINIECSAFEGNNNAYLFTEGPVTLVDTAAATPEIRSQFRDGLADHGVAVEDVDRILLSHFHADHAGLAGEIQAESGATVYAHPADAPLIEQSADAWSALKSRQAARYDEWGMPEHKRADTYRPPLPGRYGEPVETTPCRPGTTFDVGSSELSVVHTPGHTVGGISFEIDGGSGVFSGDALLPVYTPNVGGADIRVTSPLDRYLETLGYFIDSEPDVVYPGHRATIDEPADRARTIYRHHEERSLRVLRTLDRLGSADAWTIAVELFGDLESIHARHGPGEVFAHADHLVRAGELVREGTEYRLADDGPSRSAGLEDQERYLLRG